MRPLIVGIAGGSASGKTQLARFLANEFGPAALTISQDWYYRDCSLLSPEERLTLNFDHPDAFDSALLREQLRALKAGRNERAPRYDYVTHRSSADGAALRPAGVILVEGLLVLHDAALRALFDLSVFVDVPADVRLMRRLRRDVVERGISVEETLRLYEHCVRAMHDEFVQPSARYADLRWSPESDSSFPARLAQTVRDRLKDAGKSDEHAASRRLPRCNYQLPTRLRGTQAA